MCERVLGKFNDGQEVTHGIPQGRRRPAIRTRHHAIPVGLLDDGPQWIFDHQLSTDEKPSFYAFADETRNLTGAEVFAQYSSTPK